MAMMYMKQMLFLGFLIFQNGFPVGLYSMSVPTGQSRYLFPGKSTSQLNPCQTYQELNDTTMTLAFTLELSDPPICDTITQNWYRFVGSTEGLLATKCPTGTECGTIQQIWMEGQIPSFYDGIMEVEICIRGNGDCCERQNKIKVKNCNSFIVYNLVSVPPCSRYCFNESTDVLVTVSTTATSSISTTEPESESKRNGLGKGELAGVIVGTLVSVVTIGSAVLILYFYKFKTVKVGTGTTRSKEY